MSAGSIAVPAGRRGSDGLGLRRAIPERMLPSLVAAMTFLASLAMAGAVAAHLLSERWNAGAGAVLTVQVPDPELPAAHGSTDADAPSSSRIDKILSSLAQTPGLSNIHQLSHAELHHLLQPWLGAPDGGSSQDPTPSGVPAAGTPAVADDISLPLPAVIQVRMLPGAEASSTLAVSLAAIAPGVLVEDSAAWSTRLLALTTSLQACAGLALLTVATVAGCVVALATRAGIATRRQAIEIVHGLGASDGYIAGRFARRAGALALFGGAAGALVALPVLAGLAHLAAPFAASQVTPDNLPGALHYVTSLPGLLPLPLLIGLPTLPLAAGAIGWLTAQGTVRVWLRRLP